MLLIELPLEKTLLVSKLTNYVTPPSALQTRFFSFDKGSIGPLSSVSQFRTEFGDRGSGIRLLGVDRHTAALPELVSQLTLSSGVAYNS
jgi:hypothetical protein